MYDETTRFDDAEDDVVDPPPAKRPHSAPSRASAPSRTTASSETRSRAPSSRARAKVAPRRPTQPQARTSSLTPGAVPMDISVDSTSTVSVSSYFLLPRGANYPDEYYRVPSRVAVDGVWYVVDRSDDNPRITSNSGVVLIPHYAAEPERVITRGVFMRVYNVQAWVELVDLTV